MCMLVNLPRNASVPLAPYGFSLLATALNCHSVVLLVAGSSLRVCRAESCM